MRAVPASVIKVVSTMLPYHSAPDSAALWIGSVRTGDTNVIALATQGDREWHFRAPPVTRIVTR